MTDEMQAPRVRWAGIAAGAVFALVAAAGLVAIFLPSAADALQEWLHPFLMALRPELIPLALLIFVGAVIVVLGAVGLVRRARRRRAADPGVAAES